MDSACIMSELYKNFIIELLKKNNCIINEELNTNVLREALKTKKINIEVFNKALWGEIEDIEF